MIRKHIKKWLYGSCPGFAGRFPYFGTTVHFPKNSEIFSRVCEEGTFEATNLNVISSLLQKDTFYIDVGTNIGLMSVPVLERFQTCQVLSFEPSPTTLRFLKQTREQNPHKARWHICGMAAGIEGGEVPFFMGSNGMDAFDGIRNTNRGGAKQQATVPMTTIDTELAKLATPRVSVIKIDVEGAELQALGGAAECLKRDRPFVLIEWNQVNLKAFDSRPEDLLTWADRSEYDIFTIPRLLHAKSVAALKMYMTFTESFLLVSRYADMAHVGGFQFMQDVSN